MSSNLQSRVDFNIIRYAACWEDARVLREAVKVGKEDRVLIVASAGDNALALLSDSPRSIRAIDLSMPQLYLCELKMAAFALLDYDAVLCLFGITEAAPGKRFQVFQSIKPGLGKGAKEFWEEHKKEIEAGVIHCGKFERYFRLFRRWLLPLVHSQKDVARLLEPKDGHVQAMFFNQEWNGWRWRALMNLFFSKAVMGRYGRDPQFLAQVQIDVPQYIRNKAEAHLKSAEATRNPFLHCIFKGAYGPYLPQYLLPRNFEAIKSNIARLHLAAEDMDVTVMREPYEVICASNIFEYMPADIFRDIVLRWGEAVPSGTRLAYWNLMVPRSFSAIAPQQWQALDYKPDWDAGFFYSRFLSDQKR